MEDLFWLSRGKRKKIRSKQLLKDFEDFDMAVSMSKCNT